MRRSGRAVPIVVALWVTLAAAASAAADPIQLVSGTIHYSRQNLVTFNAVTADGAHLNSEFGNFLTETWNPDHACFGCTPGSTIDLSQSESFTGPGGPGPISAGGGVRVGDIDYWTESLDFLIESGSFILPDSSGGAINFSAPFSFRGAFTGRSDAGTTLTFSFFGSGTATASFAGNDWFHTTYAFAAPTPEPGTLLLLGGPAALAFLRRRRGTQPPPS
jgi:hypothetical protein